MMLRQKNNANGENLKNAFFIFFLQVHCWGGLVWLSVKIASKRAEGLE